MFNHFINNFFVCFRHYSIAGFVYTGGPTVAPKLGKGNETNGVTDCSKCKCDGRLKKTLSRQEKQEAMEFEDTLHDLIFRKRITKSKKTKRDAEGDLGDEATREDSPESPSTVQPSTAHAIVENFIPEDDDWGNIPKHYKNCSNSRSERDGFCNWVRGDRVSVVGLKHFTNYIIEVVACHEKKYMADDGVLSCDLDADRIIDGQKTAMCCSKPQRINQRTLKLRGADDVDVSTLRVEQHRTSSGGNNGSSDVSNTLNSGPYLEGGVHVTWDSPPNPNAFIVTYTLEYIRDVEGVCIIHNIIIIDIVRYIASTIVVICLVNLEYMLVHNGEIDVIMSLRRFRRRSALTIKNIIRQEVAYFRVWELEITRSEFVPRVLEASVTGQNMRVST